MLPAVARTRIGVSRQFLTFVYHCPTPIATAAECVILLSWGDVRMRVQWTRRGVNRGASNDQQTSFSAANLGFRFPAPVGDVAKRKQYPVRVAPPLWEAVKHWVAERQAQGACTAVERDARPGVPFACLRRCYASTASRSRLASSSTLWARLPAPCTRPSFVSSFLRSRSSGMGLSASSMR